jgi:hypothetical protein
MEDTFKQVSQVVRQEGFASAGEEVVITAAAQVSCSSHFKVFETGSTRLLRIMKVEGD